MALGFPKPVKGARQREKAAVKRREQKVVQDVRPQVVVRDGYCRLQTDNPNGTFARMFGLCQGASEWAHWDEYKRARTRGLPPEDRHTKRGSLMLCTKHHEDYDHGRLDINALTERECNGPLEFYRTAEGWLYREAKP